MKSTPVTTMAAPARSAQSTVFSILFSISFAHLVNDMLQSVIPSVYPIFKEKYGLTFTQIGLITLVYQLTASLLQPLVGVYTDRKARPYSLPIGMAFTLTGLIALAFAKGFYNILFSVSFIGIGSSIFHPESSRVAHLASGGKKGLAQSIFQLGGNAGSAIGPLLAALLVAPYGQTSIAWFSVVALLGIVVLSRVSQWYGAHIAEKAARKAPEVVSPFSRNRTIWALVILVVLIFSKYFYMACMSSYYTFFLIDKFQLTTQQSQMYLFIFLGAVAAGTFIGGPLGDRFGRKYIIWFSILGVAPFTLALPYVPLFWTAVLSAIIGVVIASAFSAILVYATELVPGKVGMIAGLFFGLAFGMGGLGSAVLGKLADMTSIAYVFAVCAYLPLIGILTGFLPDVERKKKTT